jgi:hypothetical protein
MRRSFVAIVSAPKGDVRAARGLIGRALRKSLSVKRWGVEPHFITYDPAWRDPDYARQNDPTFRGWATGEEVKAFLLLLSAMSEAEGWSRTPADLYHD